MPQDVSLFGFFETLWGFLPGGKTRFATLDPTRLSLDQARLLNTYRGALTGLNGALLIVLVYPRIWTLLLGLILGPVYLIRRNQAHKALVAAALGVTNPEP